MDNLQAPPPSKRPGMTASQWLYQEYLTARETHNTVRMKAASQGMAEICKRACGHLRPHYEGKFRSYLTFVFDGWKARLDFAEEFVGRELRRKMTPMEARHIGRRCKLRLIDRIRQQTGFDRSAKEREEKELEFRTALMVVQRMPGDGSKLWGYIKNCDGTRRDFNNATIARLFDKSEGWIRKLRKRLAAHLWSVAQDDKQRWALEVLRLKPEQS